MRYDVFDHTSGIVLGISPIKPKSFERCVICIEENSKVYKVFSLAASKDGSISAFFNYCKEKRASLSRRKHIYKPGIGAIKEEWITDISEVDFNMDGTVKMSLHRSGFVQFSGTGIVSGIDKRTHRAKGFGVFSQPMSNPVSSGPSFGIQLWGIDKGFKELTKREKNTQYISLSRSDFYERTASKGKPLNTYILEFWIFPQIANPFVYMYKGNPYIKQYRRKLGTPTPRTGFVLPVADLKNFDGVIGFFPCTMYTDFPTQHEFGYLIFSPGGHLSPLEIKDTYLLELACLPQRNSISHQAKFRSVKFTKEDAATDEA